MLTITEIVEITNGKFIGQSQQIIKHLTLIEDSDSNSISFLQNKKYLEKIDKSFPGLLLINKELSELLPRQVNRIIVKDAKLAFALLSLHYTKTDSLSQLRMLEQSNIHPTAIIGNNVKVSDNVKIKSNVVIENGVSIGSNSIINSNVVICHGVRIGKNVIIDSGSIIGSEGFGNVQDEEKRWHHIFHQGSVLIMDNVMIGANCTIDRGTLSDTIISDGVVIDNQVHIAHNVTIGKNTEIAAKVGIAGSTVIGENNLIGGMAGIINNIKTCNDVTISPTSTVINNIESPGIYSGFMPTFKHSLWKRIVLSLKKIDKILNLNSKK